MQILQKWRKEMPEKLTFDYIKKNCVPGETVFKTVESGGAKARLYYGFTEHGRMLTNSLLGAVLSSWSEEDLAKCRFKIKVPKKQYWLWDYRYGEKDSWKRTTYFYDEKGYTSNLTAFDVMTNTWHSKLEKKKVESSLLEIE